MEIIKRFNYGENYMFSLGDPQKVKQIFVAETIQAWCNHGNY